jgi:prepilin-type N-terminal cleavage/methylation domain-containing protein
MAGLTTKAELGGSRAAFTLIEMLAVVAMLAVLMSLLFPVVDKAIEHARKSACMSNQRQIGVAFISFAIDNQGRVPTAGWREPGSNLNAPRWNNVLAAHAGLGPDIFRCPADDERRLLRPEDNWSDTTGIPPQAESYASYAANGHHELTGRITDGIRAPLDPRGISDPLNFTIPPDAPILELSYGNRSVQMWAKPVRMHDFPHPANLILVAEGGWGAIAFTDQFFDQAPGRYTRAHKGGTQSFLFADGRVEHMKMTQTIQGLNRWSVNPALPATDRGFINHLHEMELRF